MNEFDKIIADKLSHDGYPVDEGMWNAIEQHLPAAPAPSGSQVSFKPALWSGIAATVVMVGGLTLMPDVAPIHQEDVELSSVPSVQTVEDQSTVEKAQPVVSSEAMTHIPQESHEIELKEAPLVNAKSNTPKKVVTEPKTGGPSNATKTPEATKTAVASSTPKALPELVISAVGIQCPGSEVTFKAEIDATASFEWIVDGVHVLEGKTASYTFDRAGDHEVTLIADLGNEDVTTKKVIHIFDQPISSARYSVLENKQCFDQAVKLTAEPGSNTYKWNVDGRTLQGNDVEVQMAKGNHNVILSSINERGCTNDQSLLVSVDGGVELFIPNSFSPNNDASNETWIPVGLEKFERHEIQVFRAQDNALVFETNTGEAWDGSLKGTSDRASRGERFIYRIVLTDECGTQKEKRGQLTVIQ